jgi:hypothetical protein
VFFLAVNPLCQKGVTVQMATAKKAAKKTAKKAAKKAAKKSSK